MFESARDYVGDDVLESPDFERDVNQPAILILPDASLEAFPFDGS